MTVLVPPEHFCIYSKESRYGTLRFLNAIETLSVKQGKRLEVHLDKVTFASAAASLLFFAIVNRAQLLTSDPNIIKFKWPKKEANPEGHRWIVATGLAVALLASTEEKLAALVNEGRYFQSAVEPYSHMESTVEMLQAKAELNAHQRSLMVTAIGEALLNVSHHAYEDPAFAAEVAMLKGKRWWQCSWFNVEKNTVVFIICDLGLGIFRSFRPNDDRFNTENHVSSVAKAMLVGESRFIGAGRGNGSEDIKRPIGSGCQDSETLLVLTGNAQYSYNSNDVQPNCEKLMEYIPGTLLQWSLTPRR